MKKLITLFVLVSTVAFATTSAEHRAAMLVLPTFVERQAYFSNIPVGERSTALVGVVVVPLQPERLVDDAQAALDFVSTAGVPEPVVTKAISLYTLGRTGEADAWILASLNLPVRVAVNDDVLRNRRAAGTYCRFSPTPSDVEKANILAATLTSYPNKILESSLKGCIREYATYAIYGTEKTPQEVYTSLESNRPKITTEQDALWWGINVTSKVN